MNPNPLEILTLAIARAKARDDDKAVKSLVKMADDEKAIRDAMGDDEITAQFVQWQAGKSPHTGEAGFVSPGGQFRKDKPAGSGDVATPSTVDSLKSHVDLSEIADLPEVKTDPGILARVKDKVTKAVELAKRAVLEVSIRSPQILSAWTDVFDHPDDLKKIGYNPGFSGTGGHGTTDPVKDSIGIPAHMAAGLVVKIGAAAVAYLKKKLGATPAQMADDEPSDEGLIALSEFLAKVFGAADQQFGVGFSVDAATIAKNLRALREEKSAGKA